MGLAATHVLTSPLRRARETAEITARELGGEPIEVVEALGEVFSAPALLARLAACPADGTVVCVGHEPNLSHFAALLLEPRGMVRIALPRSGVIGLQCGPRPAAGAAWLLFALPPRELLRVVP
jgi:phosphohistidine phosphatase